MEPRPRGQDVAGRDGARARCGQGVARRMARAFGGGSRGECHERERLDLGARFCFFVDTLAAAQGLITTTTTILKTATQRRKCNKQPNKTHHHLFTIHDLFPLDDAGTAGDKRTPARPFLLVDAFVFIFYQSVRRIPYALARDPQLSCISKPNSATPSPRALVIHDTSPGTTFC
uniref:Uncharacterized protein n=1 Tax=Mycena chlorophos TaxID=658473 RepID=A0ABQ0L5D3_MYCCL|nr:predicted protein [Mycena chlorophos]